MQYAISDVTHLRDVFAALGRRSQKARPQRLVSRGNGSSDLPKTYDFHPERAWERLRRGAQARSLRADGSRRMAEQEAQSRGTFRAAAF